MITPAEIEAMPLELESRFKELEIRIMDDIIRKLKENGGEITRATDWQIHRLYELGKSKKVIKEAIQKALNLSDKEIQHIYTDIISSGYARDESIYKVLGKEFIPFGDNEPLQQLISAVEKQTEGELYNITQSLGFAVEQPDGKIKFKPIAEFYQDTLDKAMFDISSGAFDYNTVLKRTVKELTKSGLRTVDYASGWSNRVPVAVRRAVVTGFNQVVAKVNEDNAEKLETDTFEVSWHSGHRPSHWWGGRWYTKTQLISVCHLGEPDGLCGCNCYHSYTPVIPGVSAPTYTTEQLEKMEFKEQEKKIYNDKEYTKYEALQRQRRLESKMRAQRQEINLLQEGEADNQDIISAQARYRTASDEYVRFSEAMGLPQQRERVSIDGLKNVEDTKFGESVEKSVENDIIDTRNSNEGRDVHIIGKIDREIYSCVTTDIVTDDVVITNERIQHIKDRHPNDFERYYGYLYEVITQPDYIIEANKPKSALILKSFSNGTEQFKTVLRLITSTENSDFKNSIITFMKINEKEWKRLVKNKKTLYKSE